MTAEAKGICLTYEMSRLMGMKEFVVARKSKKPYMQNAISFKACSVTTQKEQRRSGWTASKPRRSAGSASP